MAASVVGLPSESEDFLHGSDELIKQLKTTKPLTGSAVLMPGERSDHLAKQAIDNDEIEITDVIWNGLNTFVVS